MPWPVHPNGLLGAQGDNDTYRIERSLRFNSADSAYLSRTPSSAGNRKTWTWSGWVKRTKISSTGNLFSNSNGATGFSAIRLENADNLGVFDWTGTAYVWQVSTNQLFRDPSAWYHIVVSIDTTQATSSNRVKIYINGAEVTSFSATTYPTQNSDTYTNLAQQAAIGSTRTTLNSEFFDGYLTEINFIDGQALTPSSFGETDAITGRWKAKAYTGTYGTNGFYLKFADNSGTTSTTLGKDSSGNGNNWTPNNFSVTAGTGNDSLVDSPTNYGTDSGVGGEVRGNYATLNNLGLFDISLAIASISDGNLKHTGSATSNRYSNSSIQFNSGKYYFEITTITAVSNRAAIVRYGQTYSMYHSAGLIDINGVRVSSSAATWTTNDVIGTAFDRDLDKISFYKNGSLIYSGTSLTKGNSYFELFSDSTDVLVANFGQRPFAYTAPSGFKALCTTNLPTPTIKKPSSYMDVVTFTANNGSGTISSLGFEPDIAWIKDRDASGNHFLHDSIRGFGTYLSPNLTNAEASGGGITSRTSNGFNYSIGNTNRWVAWAWDEAPIAGMDIVSYTGDGNNNRSVPHNLGVVPSMVIIKSRNYGTTGWDWVVYHKSLNTSTEYLLLNSTAAKASASGLWAHTSSNLVFPTAYSSTNSAGVTSPYATFIAYLFAEVEGFSKFGSYTGNGSSDGPFVWCGFRPRWVMIKKTTDTLNADWRISDSARSQNNVIEAGLYANLSLAEDTLAHIDYCSNGFKLRTTGNGWNGSGSTYIFAAFAESPFKYARAR